MKIFRLIIFVFLVPANLLPQGDEPDDLELGAAQYLMTPDEAIAELFGDDFHLERDTIRLKREDAKKLSERLHQPIADSSVIVQQVFQNQKLEGYAIVTEEYGKYRPITMMVATTRDLAVRGVRILVYRENRGGEVKRKRFLHQYQGKQIDDPIQINRDIINISGATISVRGVNAGVRKVLAIIKYFYNPTT